MSSLRNKAIFAAQKNFSSACFFMPFYLVNPNNCVTHTQGETNIKVRATRAQYTIKSLINKGCARSFS